MNTFTPSPYQSAVFSWIAGTSAKREHQSLTRSAVQIGSEMHEELERTGELPRSNLLIQACAGSGKTTTILEAMRHIPAGGGLVGPSVCFLAFNKSIAETLQSRVPKGVSCKTFHALGLAALKSKLDRKFSGKEIDGRKCFKLGWDIGLGDHPDFQNIVRLVSLAKGSAGTSDSEQASKDPELRLFERLAVHHGFNLDEPATAFRGAARLLQHSTEKLDTIDFDDMLYLPIVLGASLPRYDWVFVDEAQDTNAIQFALLRRMMGENTRMVFVGDEHQAIYGFRGSEADSMNQIRAQFQCSSLPLSVSYRCSQAVVKEAQRILKQPTT